MVSQQQRQRYILVVDDELDIVVIFRQALSRQGYEVFGFTDPLLALEHFRLNAKEYALVISDMRMPQMSDFEFSISPVKINDFLRKPVDVGTLVKKVKVAMAN